MFRQCIYSAVKLEHHRVVHANAEIELEKQKAADGMRRRIADISVNVAEKLLARSVDGSEHRRLIDSAIDEIGNEDVNNQ